MIYTKAGGRVRCTLCGELSSKGNTVDKYRTADGVPFYAHLPCARTRAGLGDECPSTEARK